jgi:transcriptional regulator with PAS, ATPase and Fis domain
LQVKLLRALQENQFYRIGGTRPVQVNLRVIGLTHKSIKELIKVGRFRDDLYYRLAHFVLTIPPLRERPDDIVPLINHFSHRFARESNIFIKGFSEAAIHAMEQYTWPGNVRELENEIKALISLSEQGDFIDVDQLKMEIRATSAIAPLTAGDMLDSNSPEDLRAILTRLHWNKTLVAKELGISRTALYNKMKKAGLM